MSHPKTDKTSGAGPPRTSRSTGKGWTRRQFIQAGAVGTAGLMAGAAWGKTDSATQPASTAGGRTVGAKPNIVFISADQLGIEALTGHGCPDVRTPNIDRLLYRGQSFRQMYSADPLCAPARSTWFTGRMASETGVVTNGISPRPGIPLMGNVLRSGGYETHFSGKWHLPTAYTDKIPGFHVLPGGMACPGAMGDTAVSEACQAFLQNRRSSDPFLLVASLMQPHDICYWIANHDEPPSPELPYGLTESELPALPPNYVYDQREPKSMATHHRLRWTPLQWRYYLWSYYRHVEMVDAEIGRILDAVEDLPDAGNTVIIFSSDHGEGQGRHKTVTKNFLYDEATKVPLIACWPGRIARGGQDTTHLISSTDILPTICDYAGVATPERMVGRSLRPLLEGKRVAWRDMVASEVSAIGGRMIRTDQYKYITFQGDPVEQLFDMGNDPWETKNVAGEAQFAAALQDHRKLLAEWESRLDPAPVRPQKVKARKRQRQTDDNAVE